MRLFTPRMKKGKRLREESRAADIGGHHLSQHGSTDGPLSEAYFPQLGPAVWTVSSACSLRWQIVQVQAPDPISTLTHPSGPLSQSSASQLYNTGIRVSARILGDTLPFVPSAPALKDPELPYFTQDTVIPTAPLNSSQHLLHSLCPRLHLHVI